MARLPSSYVFILFLLASAATAPLIVSQQVTASPHLPQSVHATPTADPTTTVGVWSKTCGASNITLTNSACGSLSVNNYVSVEVNVTSAPEFNAYEFSLYFDPHFLKFNSSDTKTGTILPNPFTVTEDSSTNGTYQLAIVGAPGTNRLSNGTLVPNGTLVHIHFKILGVGVSPLVLAAGMETPSFSALQGAWTRLTLGNSPLDIVTTDGYFKNDPVHLGPVASFTYSPSAPQGGDQISFNATNSYDPDNLRPGGIKSYIWEFGSGGARGGLTSQTATVTFAYGTTAAPLAGNFSVRLTVVDNDTSFLGMKTLRLYIAVIPVHDIGIILSALPSMVNPGDKVTLTLIVSNTGTFNEKFNLTLQYGPPTKMIDTKTLEQVNSTLARNYTYTLDTTGLAPGSYSVSASAKIPVDATPMDNDATAVITVQAPGSSTQFLFLAIGAVAVVAALVAVGLFMRRRGRRRDVE